MKPSQIFDDIKLTYDTTIIRHALKRKPALSFKQNIS